MKLTIVQTPRKLIPDAVVRRAIEYLDSSTDYRESLPPHQQMQTTSRRERSKRTNDVEEFLLVFVPILLVGVAVVAAVYW